MTTAKKGTFSSTVPVLINLKAEASRGRGSTTKVPCTASAIIANPECGAPRNKRRDVIKNQHLLFSDFCYSSFSSCSSIYLSFSLSRRQRDLMQIQMARSLSRYDGQQRNGRSRHFSTSSRPHSIYKQLTMAHCASSRH